MNAMYRGMLRWVNGETAFMLHLNDNHCVQWVIPTDRNVSCGYMYVGQSIGSELNSFLCYYSCYELNFQVYYTCEERKDNGKTRPVEVAVLNETTAKLLDRNDGKFRSAKSRYLKQVGLKHASNGSKHLQIEKHHIQNFLNQSFGKMDSLASKDFQDKTKMLMKFPIGLTNLITCPDRHFSKDFLSCEIEGALRG